MRYRLYLRSKSNRAARRRRDRLLACSHLIDSHCNFSVVQTRMTNDMRSLVAPSCYSNLLLAIEQTISTTVVCWPIIVMILLTFVASLPQSSVVVVAETRTRRSELFGAHCYLRGPNKWPAGRLFRKTSVVAANRSFTLLLVSSITATVWSRRRV